MRRTILAVVAVAASLGVIAALFVIPGLGLTVTVTQVTLQSAGSCGIGSFITSGFSLPAAGEEQFSSAGVNAPNCVIDSIVSNTSGFDVISTNTPYTVGQESQPLRWVVQGPIFFSGNLTFVIHGTALAPPSNTTGNPNCPDHAPCDLGVPQEFYLYSQGEVLPSTWIVVEAAALGTLVGIVTWGITRKH